MKFRTVSCGCCSLGCCCHIHQDINRGPIKKVCDYHKTVPHPMVCQEFDITPSKED